MTKIAIVLVLILLSSFQAWAGDALSLYFEGDTAYMMRDYEEALAKWTEADAKEDNQAAARIARMYADGVGLPQDHSEAAKWWRKAAETWNYAQYELVDRQGDIEGLQIRVHRSRSLTVPENGPIARCSNPTLSG